MAFEIIRNDITRVKADAIVNTANPFVAVGAGVDSAIYEAAGRDKLFAEREKIGEIAPGEARVTTAFDLDAKYLIHTVGPAWYGGEQGEPETLASCYRNSLALAKQLKCESVAFPLISAGTYGFPKDLALKTAIAEISSFLFENEMSVLLVVYTREAFEISSKAFGEISSFIEENEVKRRRAEEDAERRVRRFEEEMSARMLRSIPSSDEPFGTVGSAPSYRNAAEPGHAPDRAAPKQKKRRGFLPSIRRRKDKTEESRAAEASEAPRAPEAPKAQPALRMPEARYDRIEDISLEEALKHKAETFQQHLFRLIDRKGMDDVEVYKRANIDRKHFSKIKSNVEYKPSKKTALAFAIALGLNLDETKDLLLRAGIALSQSNTFDIIMEYCIRKGIRDIYEINCMLFKFDQPLLGA